VESHRGKPSVKVLDLRPSDQAGVLTSGAEHVTLGLTRGDEAEILIQEILAHSDRLITLVGEVFHVSTGEDS